jgi:hypothetical protein
VLITTFMSILCKSAPSSHALFCRMACQLCQLGSTAAALSCQQATTCCVQCSTASTKALFSSTVSLCHPCLPSWQSKTLYNAPWPLLLLQVLCFEYTLTSEAPFPKQLNEAMAVYKALISSGRYKPENIALWGASAGGGLAPALLLQAKQQKLPLPAALMLMSPWGDMTKSGDTMTTLNGYDPMLQYELTLQQPAMAYVGGNAKLLQDTRVSPLKANVEAFKGFPPTLTQIGLRDSFLSQAIMMHRKLRAAGVDAAFSPWEGMWHIFQGENQLPEAQEAHRENAAFLVKHLKLAAGSSE